MTSALLTITESVPSTDTAISFTAALGKKHKSDRKTIIAVDGEGVTRERTHYYTLLAASNGEYIERADEITTVEALDFLTGLKKDTHRNYLVCGFSLNYDINMWLRDLPREAIERLLKEGKTYWRWYVIHYKPGKTFYVKDRRNGRAVTVYDVFGFYQCSFVKALKDWKVGTPDVVERIASMKEKRGEFDKVDAALVKVYCFEECELLVQLVERLIAAVNRADIPCSQWYGVGALASGMLKKYGAKAYMQPPPLEMQTPILSAYFGGRFEIAGTGHFGAVWTYDIKSAYPSVARSLPCLAHSSFRYSKRYDANARALWHCKWDVDKSNRWGPFPWRTAKRQILYPLNGEGWYWSREVTAAKALYGNQIRIVEGYILETSCEHRPFFFIDDVYKVRRQYEAAGDFAHKALKLSLNALYGKTAQGIGGKKVPPYQSYIWSGMITAGCRAQILDAMRKCRNIISVATDGIIATEPIDLPLGKELGQWEFEKFDQCFLVQPGIYRLTTTTNGVYIKVEHTRGFGSKETDFDAIERDYARNPLGKHKYSATRFIGASAAMAHKDYGRYWRKWIEQQRVINFYPYQRFVIDLGAAQAGIEPIWTQPATLAQVEPSTPYEPKQSWLDSWLNDVDLLIDLDQP